MYENLIAVCYPAGSRGEAIARIIELSPSVYRRNPDRMAEPDQVGRMNKTVTRFGWLTDFDVQPLFGMIEYMNQRGIYFKFDHTLAHDIIEDWQRIVPQLLFAKDQNHRYRLHEIMCRHKIVVSDHVHSVHMRQLLPGCKTVAVCGDSRLAIDLLYQKWLAMPPAPWSTHQPNIHAPTNLDREVANGRDMTVYPVTDAERRAYIISQYEEIELGMQHLMADTAAYHVDFVELFEKDTSYFLYHDMMAHLEIEPNWPEVSRFIAKYRALQPARSDYIKHLLK